MKLSSDEVKRIALLARVGVTGGEVEQLRTQLSIILTNFDILQEVDTLGVVPTAHVVEMDNPLREDEVATSLAQGEVLANAPRQEEGFFRIRAVLE